MVAGVANRNVSLKKKQKRYIKPLKAEVALQKGVEVSFEIFFYAVVVFLTLFDVLRKQSESKIKLIEQEKRLKETIKLLDENLDVIRALDIECELETLDVRKRIQALKESTNKVKIICEGFDESNSSLNKAMDQLLFLETLNHGLEAENLSKSSTKNIDTEIYNKNRGFDDESEE